MERDQNSERILTSYLSSDSLFSNCYCYKVIGSTNDECRRLAVSGAREGTVVVAEGQSCGRGRMGRRFYSPIHTGLYMSLLVKPNKTFMDFGLITACAAVAVHDAIEKITGIKTSIKWVNDLYLHNKKVCGILAEGHFMGDDSFLVLGVGINIRRPLEDYHPEIQKIATSLEEVVPDQKIDRLMLCAECIRQFEQYYRHLPERSFLDTYRSASCVIGQHISFEKSGEKMVAKAVGIDEDARLVVTLDSGEKLALSSGEINLVRPIL